MLTEIELEAIILSLKVALWAVISILPLGISLGWLLARRNFIGKSLVDGIIHLPLVVPPVAIGYLLLVSLGQQGAIGNWLNENFGVTLIFTWKGAAVAAAVMSLPLMVRPIRLSLEAVDQRLETAARTLGATPIQVFFHITLPLVAPGILTGVVLAFARSLGEFGATITFVSNIPGETRTLPIALYSVLQSPGGEEAALRLASISIALALLALLLSEIISQKLAQRISGRK